jgi:protein-disulfide isomerase
MTSNSPAGRPSSEGATPPPSRRSGRQRRLANREANRAVARAGSRSSSGSGMSMLLWTIGAIVVAAIVVVGAMVLTNQKQSGGQGQGAIIAPGVNGITPSQIPSNGLTLGNADAKITVDLYGDFRCTGCFAFSTEGTEAKLIKNYIENGKAKLVWHDFLVVDSLDGDTASRDAANAARCGADQGKFWTMHDWLYANQSPSEDPAAFTIDRLKEIGKQAGLDTAKYYPCVENGNHNGEIKTDQDNKPEEVLSTPSVYVAGTPVGTLASNGVRNPPSWAELQTAMEAALNPSAAASASASAAAASASAATTPTASPVVSPSAAPSASSKAS